MSKCQCKRGFPKYVVRDKAGRLAQSKFRPRVVCLGVAAELRVKCRGQRSALGSVVGKRSNEYFAPTSAILAEVFRSNTNLQVNYRIPILESTHDAD